MFFLRYHRLRSFARCIDTVVYFLAFSVTGFRGLRRQGCLIRSEPSRRIGTSTGLVSKGEIIRVWPCCQSNGNSSPLGKVDLGRRVEVAEWAGWFALSWHRCALPCSDQFASGAFALTVPTAAQPNERRTSRPWRAARLLQFASPDTLSTACYLKRSAWLKSVMTLGVLLVSAWKATPSDITPCSNTETVGHQSSRTPTNAAPSGCSVALGVQRVWRNAPIRRPRATSSSPYQGVGPASITRTPRHSVASHRTTAR